VTNATADTLTGGMAPALRRVTFALALLAAPLAAKAQPAEKVYRIGFLGAASSTAHGHLVEAFRQGLRDHGYVEGRNLAIEYRWAEGKYERLPGLAAELVPLTHGTPGSITAKQATTTIPVVMAISGDTVATELVASIGRPGGNITGATFFFPELMAKRLELLNEALPRVSRMAALANADNPAARPALKVLELMARTLRVDFQAVEVRGPDEFRDAFSAMVKKRAGGVVVIDDAMIRANVRGLADFAAKKPASIHWHEGLRHSGWPDGLRGGRAGNLAPNRSLRRQDLQGRQTRGSAHRAGHTV
jgi:putative ABC transport system substrate-binding protein